MKRQHVIEASVDAVRSFKRTSTGSLIVANVHTPPSEQRYGYVLAPIEVSS